jgi:hypothetical protein
MDCPDASQLAPTRSVSVTALQALSMLHNRFIVRYSEHLAERLARDAGDDRSKQIALLCELAYNRPATRDEVGVLTHYAEKHGLANACRVVLNSNEFMFVN